MAKRTYSFWLNAALVDRLDEHARTEERQRNAIVEQALAEYLHVPLANRELPEAPVEICPRCERGVVNEGICRTCNWRRDNTREQQAIRAHGTYRETNPKYTKWIKEAA